VAASPIILRAISPACRGRWVPRRWRRGGRRRGWSGGEKHDAW